MFLAISADDDYKRSVIGVFFLERNCRFSTSDKCHDE